jgi:hypothetical protein
MTLAIRGFSSSMAQAFLRHLPAWEKPVPVERGECNVTAERHLFCNGLIYPKSIQQQSKLERIESFEANLAMTIAQCNKIIAVNDEARILIIGSESGFAGSFDDTYAAMRAGLHRYIEIKKLRTEHQQLVGLAPGIIEDSRMTAARTDLKNLAARKEQHPKHRFLTMLEVCRWMHFLLYVDDGYATGMVVRLNGGAHTR